MANTKTTKATQKSTEKEVVIETAVTNETDALKAKIAEQEKQMADLMAQIKLMMQAQASVGSEEKKTRPIKFISLVQGGLTLKGNRLYYIENQFDYKLIPEGEATAIVSNMPNTIAEGLVYIADKDFVSRMELDGIYEEILSDVQLRELLHKSAEDVCEIYQQASPAQKEIIIDMIVNRKMNGLSVDANIVVEIGKLCGKDLMSIEPEEE